MINARELLVDLAIMASSLSAAPDKLEDYLDLIATCPADRANPKRCRELAAMSSCALTVRGLWRRAGVAHRLLLEPYRDRMAVSDVVEIARDAKALRGLDYELDRGDVIIHGEGNNVHVLTVTARAGADVWSVDGGQHAGLFEAIADKHRLEVDLEGARLLGGRLCQFVIDAGAIAERWGIGADVADTDPAPAPIQE